MWEVDRPDIDTGETYDTCTCRIQNQDLKQRMEGIRSDILTLSDEYDSRAVAGEMHLINCHQAGLGSVVGDDLIKNYTQRMVPKEARARAIYDALKILPQNNRCPLCNYGQVETLDHVLPQRLYPGFSVKPTNLVGSCDRCNRLKREAYPTGPRDGFLHPYFDSVNHTIWLIARIIVTTPPAATFHVGKPRGLNNNLISRIRTQFDQLKLARLYSDVAADEIVNLEEALKWIYNADGSNGVKEHLDLQCNSRRCANLNSWQAALYCALADSPWYCNGGFSTGVSR